jgi:hypothetical protein
MTTIRMEFEGIGQFRAAIEAAGDDIRQAAGEAVMKTALDVDRDIKKRIQGGPKSGTVYSRSRGLNRRTHQASAPYQAPATDTGALVQSITFRRVDLLTSVVFPQGPGAAYARRLELGGTVNGVYIAPRPAWRPAVAKAMPKFKSRLETALARVINGGGGASPAPAPSPASSTTKKPSILSRITGTLRKIFGRKR